MNNSIFLLDLYALRLYDGLEWHLRTVLSKQEETSHDLGEAPGAVVPPLRCDNVALPETFWFRLLP